MTDGFIDIQKLGITPAEALRRLFNNSMPVGLGVLQNFEPEMNLNEAEQALKMSLNCDYVRGRVIKVNFGENPLWVALYDRDNGAGAALRALSGPGVEEGPR